MMMQKQTSLEKYHSGALNHDDSDDEVLLICILKMQVVAEFDVFLTPKMKDDIHLLQYPLRPSYRPYGDQGELIKVEMAVQSHLPAGGIPSQNGATDAKEKQKAPEIEAIRLHYGLNKASPNYDENACDNKVRYWQVIILIDNSSLIGVL